jgi:hypothetical protein
MAALERRVTALERQLQGGAVSQIPTVAVLPVAGRQGRVLMLSTDSTVWKDTGSAWVLL